MAISVKCACGRVIQAPVSMAGKKGNCPACRASIVVPSTKGAMAPMAAPAIGVKAPAPSPPAPPKVEKGSWEEVLVRKLPTTAPKEWEEQKSFPSLVLGILVRPFHTLEYIGGYLAQRTNLTLAFVLFAVSVGAQGFLGALRLDQPPPSVPGGESGGSSAPSRPLPEPHGPLAVVTPKGIEGLGWGTSGTNVHLHGRFVTVFMEAAPGEYALETVVITPAGKYKVIIAIYESGQRGYIGGYDVTLSWRRPKSISWEQTVDHEYHDTKRWYMRTEGEVATDPPQPVEAKRAAPHQPNNPSFDILLDGAKTGIYTLACRTKEPLVDGKPMEFEVLVLIKEHELREGEEVPGAAAPAARPSAPVRAARAAPLVLGTIFAVTLALIVNAFLVDLVGRALGGGGQFLLLLAALALVSGALNLADFGIVLTAAKVVGWSAASTMRLLLAAWSVVLGIVVVMKVYDFGFVTALATCIAAGIGKFYLGIFVIGFVSKVF